MAVYMYTVRVRVSQYTIITMDIPRPSRNGSIHVHGICQSIQVHHSNYGDPGSIPGWHHGSIHVHVHGIRQSIQVHHIVTTDILGASWHGSIHYMA